MTRMTPAATAIVGEDAEKYRISSRARVISTLQGLVDIASPVTVYFNGGAEYLVTNLLALNTEFEETLFEPEADEASNRAMLAAAPLTFVSFLHNVRVQWSASRAEPTLFQGGDAFRARVPDSILWFQRRRHDRIATPVVNPLKCCFTMPGRTHEAVVMDLSQGGLGIMLPADELALSTGQAIGACRLQLPGHGEATFSIVVRNLIDVPMARPPMRRYGCEFRDLDADGVARVVAYLADLQVAREGRAWGAAADEV